MGGKIINKIVKLLANSINKKGKNYKYIEWEMTRMGIGIKTENLRKSMQTTLCNSMKINF